MTSKINFHTHTCFCDGKDTPEEMVKKAISLGFSALGFSGHAYTPCEPEYAMSIEAMKKYKDEIYRLKHIYRNDIDIFCGLEMDYYSEADTDDFDFVIGSVHYLEKNGVYHAVDASVECFERGVEAFDNDVYAFVEEYYRLLEDVVRKTDADIIGHFDLLTKFNEGQVLFCEAEPRYVAAAMHAADVLLNTGKVFEINTGAMARGCRRTPYPAPDILKRIVDGGGKLIMSSDCHDKAFLDYGFDDILSSDIGSKIKNSLITYRDINNKI